MTGIHTGGCLCGAVRYTTSGPMREVVFCHCGQCRKQTGLYYASTNVADSDIAIEGADEVTWYHSSDKGRRGFCKHCGSTLFWKYEGTGQISIQAGSVDMPTNLTPGYHIFCADKGDFYEINDGLPQFRKDSPGIVTNTE
ncbi:GFA family protein [Rhizobium sp. KVB221]|uniref:GFA family protein n=1 Tax=Rhizobium setariae TaxID=2801340 RepID=A0A937CR26_9HYPH|nr:GFA family protein [Rhizobium setariae]MBL0373822.1 GFA family protein [Rhizobium setariae]